MTFKTCPWCGGYDRDGDCLWCSPKHANRNPCPECGGWNGHSDGCEREGFHEPKGEPMSDTPKIGEVWHHDKYGDCHVLRDVDKDGDWLMEDSDGKGLYLIQDERHEWTRVDAPIAACPDCGNDVDGRTNAGHDPLCARRDPMRDTPAPAPEPDTAALIREECDALCDMLLAKNAAYGDSAIRPLRVFSRASATEQLLVRLDDKLSRLARGSAAGEDVELDLLGYLVLLRVARRAGEGGAQ